MFNVYTFLIYALITAYTPGPNTIMSMSNASQYGFKKSFPFNLGIFWGFLIVMIFCTLLSVQLFALIPTIKPIMLLLGGAYMLYLAFKTFKSSHSLEIKKEKRNGFLQGMLLQFINLKIIIHGITAMSSYILPYYSDPLVLIGFSFLLAIIGFSATLCWGIFGAIFHKLFLSHAKFINTIMALLLVYCAVSLFL